MKSWLYRIYEKMLWAQVRNGPSPGHIGLIVDGNRRFARGKGLELNEGHHEGSVKVKQFLRWCFRLEIKVITLFGFSTENFNRSDEEVDYLMSLIMDQLKQFQTDPEIISERVKVKVIGRRENLSDEMNTVIDDVESMTASHDRFLLNIALSYGGR
ncbi:MAG: di-trans,poly-cis-decaprenylcistransferase, partial [Gammaproteobacteria bacterium]|nr:di-trans,poly-cis-decaprenylcistransferase [Gammaproteobacteria bacterium]